MVQFTSSFVATVLLVAPAILAVPVSQESFEARGMATRLSSGAKPARLAAGHLSASHHKAGYEKARHEKVGHAKTGHGSRPSKAGAHRPAPLNLGSSKRLRVREEIEDLSAREPLSGRRPSSGGLSPAHRATGLGRSASKRLSGSHSEGHRLHSAGHLGQHRATGLGTAKLGGSKRLRVREDIEDLEELSAREPLSGRRPTSGGLSPTRKATGLGHSRLGGSHSEGHRLHSAGHLGQHRATGLGRRPTGLGSAKLGASKRLRVREDIEDVEELSAREPEPLKTPSSASGRISPSLRAHSLKPSGHGLSHASSRTASNTRGSAKPPARRLGGGKLGSNHHLANSRHSESGHRHITGGSKSLGSKGSKGSRITNREDLEEFVLRDIEDIEELSIRDLEDIEEFIAREDFEELMAREPGVKEWFQNLGKKIKGIFVHKKKPAPAPAAEATGSEAEAVAARSVDVEMEDLLEREIDLD